MLVSGVVFLTFGILAVFSNRFLRFMYRTFWKESDLDKRLFPGKTGYIYDKYVQGIGSIVIGSMLLLFAIFAF